MDYEHTGIHGAIHMTMMAYTCPVCGYDKLDEPPAGFNICDCCGTEFGYHDATFTHAALREQWLARGTEWHSPDFHPPPGWNPAVQLLRLDMGCSTT